MIGVDYDLFWTLNPKSLQPFIRAFVLSQRNKDLLAWQSGMYVRLAVASSLSDKVKYPKEPFSGLVDETVWSEEERAERKKENIKQKMMERMAVLNTRFKEKCEVKSNVEE